MTAAFLAVYCSEKSEISTAQALRGNVPGARGAPTSRANTTLRKESAAKHVSEGT
jgi:hypothetical protein